MFGRNLKNALTATAAGAAMLTAVGTVPAQANFVIDGVNLPVGGTLIANVIDETLITSVGQKLSGIGIINSITDNSLNTTYTYGQGGVYLTLAFDGSKPNAFTSSFILPPSAASGGYIEFTGGNATIYALTSAPNLATGNQAQDLLNAEAGATFLVGTPQLFGTNPTVIAAGGPTTTTLEALIPNNNTLSNFVNAFGSAFFDATGGDAKNVFHTCSFAGDAIAGAPCPVGKVDLTFTESFNTLVAGDFPVSGTGNLKANIQQVPEPSTLAFLGAGLALLGFGAWRRKASQA